MQPNDEKERTDRERIELLAPEERAFINDMAWVQPRRRRLDIEGVEVERLLGSVLDKLDLPDPLELAIFALHYNLVDTRPSAA